MNFGPQTKKLQCGYWSTRTARILLADASPYAKWLFSESFTSCHCCERNFEYLNWLSTRTCGAGRPHVGLCPAHLVTCNIHCNWKDSIRDSIRYSIRTQTADSQVPSDLVRHFPGHVPPCSYTLERSAISMPLLSLTKPFQSRRRTLTWFQSPTNTLFFVLTRPIPLPQSNLTQDKTR